MRFLFLIFTAKLTATLSRLFNIGAGSTWPGHLALKLDFRIFRFLAGKLKKGIILVAGTNGKTTTVKMMKTIMKNEEMIHNESGANLLNGIVSALINKTNWLGQLDSDWAIFETDEATLPLVLKEFPPKIVVLLNLFRDQLDRYGEIDLISEIWRKALRDLPSETILVLNADDPQIAYLGKNIKNQVVYFGINRPGKFLTYIEHATDSIFCQNCGSKLIYEGVYFSHLGIWKCPKCKNKRPEPQISNYDSPLIGFYNEYNTLAAVSVAKSLGLKEEVINRALRDFTPAFGRQEEFILNGKKIKIFLSKNPAGFNASLRTVIDMKVKHLLLVLNDRIPDGRDVSWIWDVDFETIPPDIKIIISGDRTYDMALRMKYAMKSQKSKVKSQNHNLKLKICPSLKTAIDRGLKEISQGETFYILATYSAMLEVRKILTGRKIL